MRMNGQIPLRLRNGRRGFRFYPAPQSYRRMQKYLAVTFAGVFAECIVLDGETVEFEDGGEAKTLLYFCADGDSGRVDKIVSIIEGAGLDAEPYLHRAASEAVRTVCSNADAVRAVAGALDEEGRLGPRRLLRIVRAADTR